MKEWKIAVVGATGLVGQTILSIMEERNFPVSLLIPSASERSAGTNVLFRGRKIPVEPVSDEALAKADIAFFAAGGAVSKAYAEKASQSGVICIDNSSEFRMEKEVPLLVPEVNASAWQGEDLIANPNCSTIQCMLPLAALKPFGIRRIAFATYQSVSGSGLGGLQDLEAGTNKTYTLQIQNNVLPQIDVLLDNGYTKEEMKMVNETRKILDLPDTPISATAVRVPVKYGHSIVVQAELEQPFAKEAIQDALASFPGIKVMQDPDYPTPRMAEGSDTVYVGRIRKDIGLDNGVTFWVVADNVRKGAATNAVQIGEMIVEAKDD